MSNVSESISSEDYNHDNLTLLFYDDADYSNNSEAIVLDYDLDPEVMGPPTGSASIDDPALLVTMLVVTFTLVPAMVMSNALVILPFWRFSRVRTPSNQILFALAASDFLSGLALLAMMGVGISKTLRWIDSSSIAIVLHSLTLVLTLLENTSLMFMVANSVDRALSLARPLHYSEMVTFTSVNIFIAITVIIAFVISVIVPLTVFHSMTTLPQTASKVGLWTFGATDPRMQISLLLFFTLPCGLGVSVCHAYVYSVASRHAKAIKRDGSVRERMSSTAYKLTAVVINNCETEKHSGNHLTIPKVASAQPRNQQHASPVKPKLKKKRSGSIRRITTSIRNNNNPTSKTDAASSRSRYFGASLAFTVFLIFATRIPCQLGPWVWPLYRTTSGNSVTASTASTALPTWPLSPALKTLLLYLPLFLCSAINPWVYAYHNLDLKPVMRRMLKKALKTLSMAKNVTGSKEAGTGNDRLGDNSLLTQWQISQNVSHYVGELKRTPSFYRRFSRRSFQNRKVQQGHNPRGRHLSPGNKPSVLPDPVSNNQPLQQSPRTPSRTGSLRLPAGSTSRGTKTPKLLHRGQSQIYSRQRSSEANKNQQLQQPQNNSFFCNRPIPIVKIWDGENTRVE